MKRSEKRYEQFGKYLIIDKLGEGGMAEIYRALYLREMAHKIVVVKKIRGALGQDEKLAKMFLEEVKVTFGFNHPNVAQTLDYGSIDDKPFLVLEYIEGRTLKEFIVKHIKTKKRVSVECAIFIISQVAQGLAYAHNYKNKLTGKSSNIIHRDISPDNIMINYDGSVKVIDFGIAKTEQSAVLTNPGTVKGKLSYLAPEYIDGKEIDQRFDIFGLGITLWELLALQKLYRPTEDNIYLVLKEIKESIVKLPSTKNLKVSPLLDEVTLKALEKEPEKRFKSMDDFNKALSICAKDYNTIFTRERLKQYMSEIFEEEQLQEQKTLEKVGQINVKDYINSEPTNVSSTIKEVTGDIKREIKEEIKKEFEEDAVKNRERLKKESKKYKEKKDNGFFSLTEKYNLRKKSSRKSEYLDNIDKFTDFDDDFDDNKDRYGFNLFSKQNLTVFLLFIFVSLFFVTSDLVKSKYSAYMGHKGSLYLPTTGMRNVKIYINEHRIKYTNKAVSQPLHITKYLRVIKKNYDPYVIPFKFTKNNQQIKIKPPEYKRSVSAYMKCVDKKYPIGSVLKIKMNDSNGIYFLKLPFNKIKLPVGEYDAEFNNQKITFKIDKKVINNVKLLKQR